LTSSGLSSSLKIQRRMWSWSHQTSPCYKAEVSVIITTLLFMNRVLVMKANLNSSLLLKMAGQESSAKACDSVSSSKSVQSSWTGTPHSSSWKTT
jgi:hypothetical protein